MLSNHDREFLRGIGIAPGQELVATLGGEDISRHISGLSVNWNGVPFLSLDPGPPEHWFHGCAAFLVMERPDARR